ncbi:invertebrate-type lysozyme 3-like [Neodiprion fabricii]|uniref:invertebrate-type lysozyme 3-like n=1 Tax=Neodiprion fabricii TaxID=2872261 RepID=UPI001ED8C68E|nr:invertebrate-type lysozyme 3-like [Neodiprion fabricii]
MMAVNFVFLATAASCMLLTFVYGQQAPIQLDNICLGCICEASSGCNQTLACDGDVCGPFRITWAFWSDAGKPTLNGEPSTNAGAYPRCANDAFCAGAIIQGYMQKFAQDCNGDAVIDCKDFARIHRLGAYGCHGGLDTKYENAFNSCLRTYG